METRMLLEMRIPRIVDERDDGTQRDEKNTEGDVQEGEEDFIEGPDVLEKIGEIEEEDPDALPPQSFGKTDGEGDSAFE